MNRHDLLNRFKEELKRLVERTNQTVVKAPVSSYSGAPEAEPLEHHTRKYFIDDLMVALGWSLGPSGSMHEEVRLKSGNTYFMDYLGVDETTRLPSLAVEAKIWNAPFVAPGTGSASSKRRSSSRQFSDHEVKPRARELLREAISHIREGGAEDDSPVIKEWHKYLVQIKKYVDSLRSTYGHTLKRVLLISGEWMLIFANAAASFEGESFGGEQEFFIYFRNEYVDESSNIFALLGRAELAPNIPKVLRPTQVMSFIKPDDVKAAFYGLMVSYESSGIGRFDQKPRMLLYPALLIQRADNVILTITLDDFLVQESRSERLLAHINLLEDKFLALIDECDKELSLKLQPSLLSDFPGFRKERAGGVSTRDIDGSIFMLRHEDLPNNFTIVTGKSTHYLLLNSAFGSCKFHKWSECNVVGMQAGSGPINIPRVDAPRSFFVDGQDFHCAHRTVNDRRIERCVIYAFEQRFCCRTCVYRDSCWDSSGLLSLPCVQDDPNASQERKQGKSVDA